MKVAFVTGANKGIGFGIVETLLKALGPSGEWKVYLTARDDCRGNEAVKELANKGLIAYFYKLDITCKLSRDNLLQYIKTNYPDGVNIFVNNAGIAYKNDSTAPFNEQARVTIKTNYTATVDMCKDIIPVLAKDARLVNVSSLLSLSTLKKLGTDLYKQFTSPMTMETLDSLIAEFVRLTETNTHESKGWPTTAYGVSKLGLTKATYIMAETLKSDPRHILFNACCPGYVDTDMTSHKGTKTILQGADTPCYLALLPQGATSPNGEFVSERKVVKWSKESEISI